MLTSIYDSGNKGDALRQSVKLPIAIFAIGSFAC